MDRQVVTDEFYHSLRMGPDASWNEAHVFDELYWCLQYQHRPIEKTCQAISQFHGPFGGSSSSLFTILNRVAGANQNLQTLARKSGNAVGLINQAIGSVSNLAGLINNISGAQMSTPFLRYFVTKCQSLHPDVNIFIQKNIGRFPYFQQISEQIGTHFTIISDCNEIDPLFWLDCGTLPIENLKTAARMIRPLFSKMFKQQAGNMEDSQNFLDTLFLRNMPCEENHAFTHPNYAKESPIAHGNNFCMDVHHQRRAEAAVPGVLSELVSILGDRIRLLNQFIPVYYKVKHEEKLYDIPVEDQIQTVDRTNRVYPQREASIERSQSADQENFDN